MIFGITPIITGLFAMKLLGERGLNLFRLIAIALSMLGLYIMLDTGLQYNSNTYLGVIGVLSSALFYSLNMVLVKKINADIDTYATVAGTMLVSCSMLTLVWIVFGMSVPTDIPIRAGLSIFYLALVGSVLGFLLFYYVLKRVEAMRVSLITLVTPIFALLIGNIINNEPLSWNIIFSCTLILSGLLFFEFEGAIRHIKIINTKD
jgi:drug/metabolite transporter (DMT)-like permease